MRTRSSYVWMAGALSLASILLLACSGGSSGEPAGGVGVSWKIPASDVRYITTSGISTGGLHTVSAGDDELNRRWVIVMQFDISGLSPAAANQVELAFHRTHNAGFPFSDLGALKIDHIGGGAPISASQFGGHTLVASFANQGMQDDYLVFVAPRVQADLAEGRTHSTFRIRFDPTTDNDDDYDQVRISTTDAPFEPHHPTLIITE